MSGSSERPHRHRRPDPPSPTLRPRTKPRLLHALPDMISGVLGSGALALGVVYLFPDLTSPPQQISIVQSMTLGVVVWVPAFLTVGLLTAAGIVLGGWVRALAHGTGVVAFGMFATAAWLGRWFSEPTPSIVGPMLATTLTVLWVLMLTVDASRER